MQLPADLFEWLKRRNKELNHRQLLVVSGPQKWVHDTVTALLENYQPPNILNLCGTNSQGHVSNKTYKHALGQEFKVVSYDAFSGIRANALMALSGCVSESGLMILLCPDLDEWPHLPDPERLLRTSYGLKDAHHKSYFISWLVENIRQDEHVCILTPQGFRHSLAPVLSPHSSSTDKFSKTKEQQRVVESIVSSFNQCNNPMVLKANRGRGKSSALGIAAGLLMHTTPCKIVVTAAHKSMTLQIFDQAEHVINKLGGLFNHSLGEQSSIQFVPFDSLLSSQQNIDLLLIDEAAIIPNHVLERLLERCPRVVFSTTVQGYEGSGRGFDLRFTPYLQSRFPTHTTMSLEEPIRWHQGDVLEAFWYKAMAMQAFSIEERKSHSNELLSCDPAQMNFQSIPAKQLINDPCLLNNIFKLLVDAHYQTSPDDLVRMLDASEQTVHVCFASNSNVIAVALCNKEGGEDVADIAVDVAQGKRRVNGHLSAQKLAFANADPKYMTLTYLRVVRIAVSQPYRHIGIGSALLGHIENYARIRQCDFVSASFGLTLELFNFWQHNHFQLVNMGIKRDPASGEFSALMCKSLKPSQQDILENLNNESLQDVKFQQSHRLASLPQNICNKILTKHLLETGKTTISIDQHINQFILANRPLYSIERQLYKWLMAYSRLSESANDVEYEYLHDLVVKRLSILALTKKYQLTGKKQIEVYARACIQSLINKQ